MRHGQKTIIGIPQVTCRPGSKTGESAWIAGTEEYMQLPMHFWTSWCAIPLPSSQRNGTAGQNQVSMTSWRNPWPKPCSFQRRSHEKMGLLIGVGAPRAWFFTKSWIHSWYILRVKSAFVFSRVSHVKVVRFRVSVVPAYEASDVGRRDVQVRRKGREGPEETSHTVWRHGDGPPEGRGALQSAHTRQQHRGNPSEW